MSESFYYSFRFRFPLLLQLGEMPRKFTPFGHNKGHGLISPFYSPHIRLLWAVFFWKEIKII